MQEGSVSKRTSDSLNEGLPIKKAIKSFKENDSSSIKMIVGSTLQQLSANVFFSLDKYLFKIWVENPIFAFQHMENGKKFY